MKVMIIDDEPLVREGLKSIINWESCGFSICAEASDGEEALLAIEEHNPDLAIIDIRMPRMTGLKLSAAAAEKGYACKFIFLSGYSDFSYAQEAIQSGAEAYLLKPVDEDTLEEAVIRVRDKIMRERQLYLKADEYAKRGELEALNAFFTYGKPPASPERLPSILLENKPSSRCLLVIFSSAERVDPEVLKKGMLFGLKIPGSSLCVELGRDALWLVASGSEDGLKALYESLPNTGPNGIYAAAALCAHTPDDLSAAYRAVKSDVEKNRFYEYKGKAAWTSLEEKQGITAQLDGYAANIGRSLTFFGIRDVRKTLSECFDMVRKCGMTVDSVKNFAADVFINAQKEVSSVYPNEDIARYSNARIVRDIYERQTLSALLLFLDGLFEKISSDIARLTNGDCAKNMLTYIENHYDEDLKLEDLAVVFGYNKIYLGRIFKSNAGESFNAYLKRLRINKAKELLITTDKKIYSIMELVGFRNSEYFYRQFHKYTNESPNEYRKKHR